LRLLHSPDGLDNAGIQDLLRRWDTRHQLSTFHAHPLVCGLDHELLLLLRHKLLVLLLLLQLLLLLLQELLLLLLDRKRCCFRHLSSSSEFTLTNMYREHKLVELAPTHRAGLVDRGARG
jgi:hypothetical protein